MKKTIISLSIIGVVAVIAIGGTIAYFNDTETSTGNIFVAGEMDLKVDHIYASYNDNECVEGCEPNESINLVGNGGFEQPVVTDPAKWDIFPSGTTGLNWTVEWRGDIPTSWGGYTRPDPALKELHRGVLGPAYAGDQYAELDTDWYGPGHPQSGEPASVKIYQDITTTPGKQYQLKFAFSPRPNTQAAQNELEVKWDGGTVVTIGPAAGGGSNSWTVYSYTVTASSNTTRLELTDLGTANSEGTFLDGVKLHPIECEYSIVGGACELWEEKDLNEGDFFFNYYPDVKPGDYGRNVISLHVYDNDAWACLIVHDKQDDDNGLTDSEEEAGDTTGGVGEGELSQYIEVALWLDVNQNNSYDAGETVLFEGSLADSEAEMRVADSITGSPLIACETYYIGLAWCIGDQTVDQGTGQITCDGSTASDMAQTDSLVAALTAFAEQWRNNPNFDCANVILP